MINNVNIQNSLFRQTYNLCKNCNKICVSDYVNKYCLICYTKKLVEGPAEVPIEESIDDFIDEEVDDFPKQLKLQRELSLPYAFPDDICNINVPLKVRLKYDRVMKELKL